MAALKGKLGSQNNVQAKTVAVAPPTKIVDLVDVDTTLLGDGAVLIYNAITDTFETKQEVDNPNTKIIGGSF